MADQVEMIVERINTTATIANQNDAFRALILGGGHPVFRGLVFHTHGVVAVGVEFILRAMLAVSLDANFSTDNDPYGDHTFGVVTISGTKLFWKIDLFADDSLTYGSEQPDDPDQTFRVLTIYLPSEH